MVNFGFGGSSVQAIERLADNRLYAVCDKIKAGVPAGFWNENSKLKSFF